MILCLMGIYYLHRILGEGKMERLQELRRLEGLKRYAECNNSDPFTLARCMTHYRQGLCGPRDGAPDMHWLFAEDVLDAKGRVIGKRNTGALIGSEAGSDAGYDALHYSNGQWGSIARI
jgi:hypothetical protein